MVWNCGVVFLTPIVMVSERTTQCFTCGKTVGILSSNIYFWHILPFLRCRHNERTDLLIASRHQMAATHRRSSEVCGLDTSLPCAQYHRNSSVAVTMRACVRVCVRACVRACVRE